jgi:hypothetical protein
LVYGHLMRPENDHYVDAIDLWAQARGLAEAKGRVWLNLSFIGPQVWATLTLMTPGKPSTRLNLGTPRNNDLWRFGPTGFTGVVSADLRAGGVILGVSPSGDAMDVEFTGNRVFRPYGQELMETYGTFGEKQTRPVASVGLGRRWLVSAEDWEALRHAAAHFINYYASGRAKEERVAKEDQRLGREVLLTSLVPSVGVRRDSGIVSFDTDATVNVYWYPHSGTDRVTFKVPVGVDANALNGTRTAIHRANVESLRADFSRAPFDDAPISSNMRGGITHLDRSLMKYTLEAWDALRAKVAGGPPTFPLLIPLTSIDDGELAHPPHAIVTVDRRRAGPLKGQPLFVVTVTRATAQGVYAHNLLGRPLKDTSFGPFTMQDLAAGETELRARSTKMWQQTTAFKVGPKEVQLILVAWDERQSQGLSGTR